MILQLQRFRSMQDHTTKHIRRDSKTCNYHRPIFHMPKPDCFCYQWLWVVFFKSESSSNHLFIVCPYRRRIDLQTFSVSFCTTVRPSYQLIKQIHAQSETCKQSKKWKRFWSNFSWSWNYLRESRDKEVQNRHKPWTQPRLITSLGLA